MRALDMVALKLAKMGYKPTKRLRWVHVPPKARNSIFTRRQLEDIFRVADRYGAKVYLCGKVLVSKPKGKGR